MHSIAIEKYLERKKKKKMLPAKFHMIKVCWTNITARTSQFQVIIVLTLHSSSFQPIPAHTSPFHPIQAYYNPFQHIPAFSSLFYHMPSYSSQINPIQAYSSIFQPILFYSTLYQRISSYSNISQASPAYSSLLLPIQTCHIIFKHTQTKSILLKPILA